MPGPMRPPSAPYWPVSPGAYRDVVLYNAAAALVVADKASDLEAGVELAADAVDSGKAQASLDRMIELTNSRNEGGEDG